MDKNLRNHRSHIERASVFGKPGPGAGMVIQLGDADSYRFLVVGRGFQVRFRGLEDGVRFTGILEAREKEAVYPDGDGGNNGEMPNHEPDYWGFPIAVTIPGRACIAEVQAYTLFDGYYPM
ncbi:hypothetical protein BJY00DRAFT_311441 [Aspergillus carlsbadensis]|nr:hypothetical protein BJY00DRAFT_311441 [Aspergillus carlsbadensis]